MSKIFDFDARKGSKLDRVSNSQFNVFEYDTDEDVKYRLDQKGVMLSNSDLRNIDYNHLFPFANVTDKISLVLAFKVTTLGYAFYHGGLTFMISGLRICIQFKFDSGNIYVYSSVSNSTSNYVTMPAGKFTNVKLGGEYLAIATYDRVNHHFYVDNIEYNGATSTSESFYYFNKLLLLGSNYQTASRSVIGVYYAKIYNHILSTTERADLFQEFLNSKPTVEPKRNFQLPVVTDLSNEQGLVAAYIPSYKTVIGGQLLDVSGNGKRLINYNCVLDKVGMKYSTKSRSTGVWGNIKSLSFRIKLKTTTEKILEGAVNAKLIFVNNGTLSYADFDNCFINGVDSDIIQAGVWSSVTITSTTDVNMSPVSIALNTVTYGNFELADIRAYSYELSVDEIKAYHNSFQQVYLRDTFKDTPVGNFPKDWVRVSGTAEVQERTTAIPELGLNIGDKYLKQLTAGVSALQSKQAYGEWEFDVYKGADANVLNTGFVQNKIDELISGSSLGYQIRFGSSENLALIKDNINVLLNVPNGSLSNNTWYRIKVARLQSEGVFKDIPTLQTSDLVNSSSLGYSTFTSNGRYGFGATSDGSGIHIAGTGDEISIVNGAKYLVEFDLKLNSGTAPIFRLAANLAGTTISNLVSSKSGRNSAILTATLTTTGVMQFNNSSLSTDYEISGLTISRIYPAYTFAVFIRGGSFGTNWTLVSAAGGSGSNPITDATYTTSEYFVTDLDTGDEISNIKLLNQHNQ